MLKVTGLDELQKRLTDLADRAQELDGEHQVALSEVLSNSFVSTHTAFASAEAMQKAGGFSIENQADFESIPQETMDAFVQSVSKFQNWQEMIGEAAKE